MAWIYKYRGKLMIAYHPFNVPNNAKGIRKVDARKYAYYNIKSSKYGFLLIKPKKKNS